MDAVWERMESAWTFRLLGHGCSVKTDGVCVHVRTLTWLGHGCSVGTDGVCVDINMAGTWMLCGMECVWTLTPAFGRQKYHHVVIGVNIESRQIL